MDQALVSAGDSADRFLPKAANSAWHAALLASLSHDGVLSPQGEPLPSWPPIELQVNTTGLSGADTLNQAFAFYEDVNEALSGKSSGIKQEWRHRSLVTFGMEMMFGRRHDVKAGVIGEGCELSQLVQHLLVALVVASNWTQALAIFERRGNGGKHKEHEFQGVPPIDAGFLLPRS